jgi:hypothetical protein
MDIALVMANVSQLKTVMDAGPSQPYHTFILVLVLLSLGLQMAFGLLLLLVWAQEIVGDACVEANGSESAKNAGSSSSSSSSSNNNNNSNNAASATEYIRKPLSCLPCSKVLDCVSVMFVLFIIVINALITGFGFGPLPEHAHQNHTA